MPFYDYVILDEKGNPTEKFVEIFQSISENALDFHPETKLPIRRVISAPCVRDSRPAWETCKDVRDYIKSVKPKWVSDERKGIKERFDPKKHG
jgi:hypothetical protein